LFTCLHSFSVKPTSLHLPLWLNKLHISFIYHSSRDILSYLHRKQKPISCCVNPLCLKGHRFPQCLFPNCVCECVCLQIVTTLMAAPAREHQMSLRLSSTISRSLHLSLRPSTTSSLHDPHVLASPRRRESHFIQIDTHDEMKRLKEERIRGGKKQREKRREKAG